MGVRRVRQMVVSFWDQDWKHRGAMLADEHPRDRPLHLICEPNSLGSWLWGEVDAWRPVFVTCEQPGGRWSGRLKMATRHKNPVCNCHRIEVEFQSVSQTKA